MTIKKMILLALAALLLLPVLSAFAEQEEVTSGETVRAVEIVEEAVELRMDSRGGQVEALQKRLYTLGFYLNSFDGIYGGNTSQAVKECESYIRLVEQKQIDEMIAAITPEPTIAPTPEPTQTTPATARPGTAPAPVNARPSGAPAATPGPKATPEPTPTPAPTAVPTPEPTPQTKVDGTADLALQERLYEDADTLYLCDVAKGDNGPAALRVQRRLVALNYLNDAADGVFGVNSETALVAFQAASGLAETGMADRETQKRLFSDDATAAKKPVYNYLTLWSSGDVVKRVQKQLIILGFMNGSASGVYDNATQKGVMALEKYLYVIDHPDLAPKTTTAPDAAVEEIIDGAAASEVLAAASDPENNPYEVQPEEVSGADAFGFEATGEMDDALQRRFLEDGIPVYSDALRKGDSGDDVMRVQRRLYSLGYLTASGVDGVFGGGTERAVTHFQLRNKMEETGIADQTTQYTLFSEDAVKSVKPYQIKVSLSEQRVYIYAVDLMDNYTILTKTFVCSSGLESSPTPKGTFTNTGRGARWHYFEKFDCWAQYAWYIEDDIMFHSVLYSQQDESTLRRSSVNALGRKASHGCVRLAVADAKWIWDNCSSGTTVVVY
ncbi:MAG: murein L,D-transpeptidase [Clostridia bacterium]|nr:murein L,D-transpeptidase [Clostridia bacterium]